MSTAVVFQQMLVIFLLILVGYGACRKRVLTDPVARGISAIVVHITNPALLVASALDEEVGISHGDLLRMALVAACVYGVLLLLGAAVPRLLRVPEGGRKFYNVMMIYGNVGFIGIPVVSAVLGAEGVIYLVVFNFFYNILFYTHGRYVLTADQAGERRKITWKTFVNVGTVSGLAAMALFWFPISLPAVISNTLSYLGEANTFLSMLVLGASLARMPLRSIFTETWLNLFCLILMLGLPVLLGMAVKQLVPDPLMVCVTVLLIAMPVGNLPLMTAQENGIPADTLARGIVLTTLLSLVTITLTAAIVL